MNKRGFIWGIVTVLILLVGGFFWFGGNVPDALKEDLNKSGGEVCIAASCCHASECVLESEAPDCNGSICTMSCEPGTMDCGAGHCEYVNENCEVVWNE